MRQDNAVTTRNGLRCAWS